MFFLLLDQTISFRNLFSISSIPPFTTLCFIVSILCICLPSYQFFVFVCLGVLPTSTLYDNYFGPVSSLKSCTIYVLNRQMLCRFNVLCMIVVCHLYDLCFYVGHFIFVNFVRHFCLFLVDEIDWNLGMSVIKYKISAKNENV